MASSASSSMSTRSFLFLAVTVLATVKPSLSFDTTPLFARDSDSCPTDYSSCGGNLPSNFCCPSSSTCLSLDNDTSALCCPSGGCETIRPITCEISQQNATSDPKATVKTTRLDDELPKCNGSCCPFGYTCHDTFCLLDKSTSKNGTTSASSSPTSNSTSFGTAVTPLSTAAAAAKPSSCSAFPSGAVAAGFFPGAVFGAVLALLIMTCLRRRTLKKQQMNQDPKNMPNNGNGILWSQRSASGAVLGISSPIPSEDASYRTDFLLRPNDSRRNSTSGRSMRSVRSRVRSLFTANTSNPALDKDVPPLPTMPAKPDPITPPRQRETSSESIKIYSPPGAFAQSKRFLGPEPYPSRIARPSTTFGDLMQAVGFENGKNEQGYKIREPAKY